MSYKPDLDKLEKPCYIVEYHCVLFYISVSECPK